MSSRRWEAWPEFMHYKVAKCMYSNWAGSGYNFAKYKNGIVRRFFTKKSAERHALWLNHCESLERGNELNT